MRDPARAGARARRDAVARRPGERRPAAGRHERRRSSARGSPRRPQTSARPSRGSWPAAGVAHVDALDRPRLAARPGHLRPAEAPVSFSAPTSLLGLLAIPILIGLYVCRGPAPPPRRRPVREPGARPEPRPALAGLAPARAVRARPRLARRARGRHRAPARRPGRDAERGDGRPRDRHVAIDGRDGRRAEPVRRRRARRRRRSSRRCRRSTPSGSSRSRRPRTRCCRRRSIGRPRGSRSRELRLGSGTALGTAVTRAVDIALGRREEEAPPTQQGERSPAAVLVLSDGAQTSGEVRPLAAAQRARRLGVPVSAVAVGTGRCRRRGAAPRRPEAAGGRTARAAGAAADRADNGRQVRPVARRGLARQRLRGARDAAREATASGSR